MKRAKRHSDDFDIWPDGAPGIARLSNVILEILRAAGINPIILSPLERTEIARILTSRLPNIPFLPISAELLHNPAKLEEALMGIFEDNFLDEEAKRIRRQEKHLMEEEKERKIAEEKADYWRSVRALGNTLQGLQDAAESIVKTVSAEELKQFLAKFGVTSIGAEIPEPALKELAQKTGIAQAELEKQLADAGRSAEHVALTTQPNS